MASISVIMPTFNRARFLIDAIRSVLAQTHPVHEIIVWDDGSTDGTGEAVAGLSDTPVPVRYFRSGNAGKSCALNRALPEASGELIWICDDDDLCRPEAAARMLAAMEATGAPVVGGRYQRFGTDPASGAQVAADPGYWPDLGGGSLLRHLLEDIFIFQNATLVRRSAYDRVGPFREDLARSIDYDMIIRLAARFPLGFVDAVLFDQRKHDGARGPAAAQHEAKKMDRVWLENDQILFRGFRDWLPVSLYEAMFEADDPALALRAGHLQRAAVYARRNLWSEALEDFGVSVEMGAGMAGQAAFGPLEHDICRRAMAGKHGCDGVFDPAVTRALTRLGQSGPAGKGIAAGLAHGIRWRLREALQAGEAGRAFRIGRFMTRMAGPAGVIRPVVPPAGARIVVPPAGARITERRSLPDAAYAW